jgi:hypothetical protein
VGCVGLGATVVIGGAPVVEVEALVLVVVAVGTGPLDEIVDVASVDEGGLAVIGSVVVVVVGGFRVDGAIVVGAAKVQALNVSLPALMQSWPL